MPEAVPPPLTPADAAEAMALRERFSYLRDVVIEMERRVPYAAAMVRSREGMLIDLRDAEQSAGRLDPQDGVVLTASTGYSIEEASTDRLDPDAVRAVAGELTERALAYRPGEGEQPLEIAVEPLPDRDFATPVRDDPRAVALGDKLARIEGIRRRLRDADRRAVQAICHYSEASTAQVFANRSGLITEQVKRCYVVLVLFVSDGTQQRHRIMIRDGTGGLERIEVGDEELAETAEVAVQLLGATPIPPRTYEIVADPVTSGIIAHEAFGHGVETDLFLKGRARAADFVGKRVGSELVNIVDDPTLPGAYGTYFVDDEGQLARPTRILRDGIFERGLTDLHSATRLGIPRTANGRRESVQRKAYARMSNTFFLPGTSTRDELLESLDDGILLCDAENGMEDPKGWGIQIWVGHGREYRGGKPTGRIFAPISITGYVPDVLESVSMVASDFGLVGGTCGKGWKELIPVSSGGPHVRARCRLG